MKKFSGKMPLFTGEKSPVTLRRDPDGNIVGRSLSHAEIEEACKDLRCGPFLMKHLIPTYALPNLAEYYALELDNGVIAGCVPMYLGDDRTEFPKPWRYVGFVLMPFYDDAPAAFGFMMDDMCELPPLDAIMQAWYTVEAEDRDKLCTYFWFNSEAYYREYPDVWYSLTDDWNSVGSQIKHVLLTAPRSKYREGAFPNAIVIGE